MDERQELGCDKAERRGRAFFWLAIGVSGLITAGWIGLLIRFVLL
jgi:hypothetical protein